MQDLNHLKELITNDPVLRIIANQATRRSIKAYLVGGYIRDALLGLHPKDADLMFEGDSNSQLIGELISEKFGSTLVRFEKHMIVYRITVNNNQYDLADLLDKTIVDDQLRRDFTINSLAVEIGSFVQNPNPDISDILDASNGIEDLHQGIIRINSKQVLKDDPLRIARMFRFERQLDFTIDPDSYNAVDEFTSGFSDISGERVRDEFFQILNRPKTTETLLKMDEVGLLSSMFPEIEIMKGVSQNEYHHLDVFEHSICAVREFENVLKFDSPITEPYSARLTELVQSEMVPSRNRAALMKLALLFHDIGKPGARAVREDGKITFIGHNKLGVEIIEPYLDYLHLSRRERVFINNLIDGHLRPGFLDPDSPTLSKAIFRFFDRYADCGIDIVLISIADRLAAQGEKVDDAVNQRHDQIAAILLDAYFNQNKLLVRPTDLIDGNNLMRELDLESGKRIGILLKVIKEGQASGEVLTYDDAIEYAKRFMNESDSQESHDI